MTLNRVASCYKTYVYIIRPCQCRIEKLNSYFCVSDIILYYSKEHLVKCLDLPENNVSGLQLFKMNHLWRNVIPNRFLLISIYNIDELIDCIIKSSLPTLQIENLPSGCQHPHSFLKIRVWVLQICLNITYLKFFLLSIKIYILRKHAICERMSHSLLACR
jgi:hypothetical protein